MYIQPLFAETRAEALHRLMRDYPFATLIVTTPQGIVANHLPIEVRAEEGLLRCHFGRGNPLWRELVDGGEALVIFRGPQAYLSPQWFDSGQRSGRRAPSWNYAAVHARGPLRLVADDAWLKAHLAALTAQQEAALATPWQIDDAPADFVDGLLGAIVGVEIRIDRLVGKWFLSQQRTAADRARIVAQLRQQPQDNAAALATMIAALDAGAA